MSFLGPNSKDSIQIAGFINQNSASMDAATAMFWLGKTGIGFDGTNLLFPNDKPVSHDTNGNLIWKEPDGTPWIVGFLTLSKHVVYLEAVIDILPLP